MITWKDTDSSWVREVAMSCCDWRPAALRLFFPLDARDVREGLDVMRPELAIPTTSLFTISSF